MDIPIRVPATFRVIAHRGSSAYVPENTRPAFELAREMGIAEVETDAQLTTDDVVVLCHDIGLERYGHGERRVEELTSGELLALDMGSWYSPHRFSGTTMMTLDQLLADFSGDFTFHIELKGRAEGLAVAVHTAVARAGAIARSVFTSFSYEQLERMRAVCPEGRLGWLVPALDRAVYERAGDLELFQLCPRADAITPDDVAAARSVAAEVRVWGVSGTPQEVRALVRRVLACGGDGMTINWPDWVTR